MRYLFLIILFTSFAIRPVMELSPFLYYQLNLDYIVENLCENKDKPKIKCNGKCYLMKQLKKKASEHQPLANNRIQESFIPLFFSALPVYATQPKFWLPIALQFREINSLYRFVHDKRIEHPPQSFR